MGLLYELDNKGELFKNHHGFRLGRSILSRYVFEQARKFCALKTVGVKNMRSIFSGLSWDIWMIERLCGGDNFVVL